MTLRSAISYAVDSFLVAKMPFHVVREDSGGEKQEVHSLRSWHHTVGLTGGLGSSPLPTVLFPLHHGMFQFQIPPVGMLNLCHAEIPLLSIAPLPASVQGCGHCLGGEHTYTWISFRLLGLWGERAFHLLIRDKAWILAFWMKLDVVFCMCS